MTTIKTTCPYCGVGCGVLATEIEGRIEIKGNPDHPANFGRLCSKGSALAETLVPDGRLLHPTIRGERADWTQALDYVADRFADVIAEHGPDAVAFYVSGQLLTEDYYVVNKLAKGFLGTANVDTNSRLCMASAVAGYKRAFGTDTVPCSYTDLEEADLVILTGSNLAWCHPVLFQRLMAARERRPSMRIVVIDPRRTATAESADLHVQLASGSDGWLFNHLLAMMADAGRLDDKALANAQGLDEALAAARASSPGLMRATGLDSATLGQLERLVTNAKNILNVYSMGINQSTSGTDKANAIINFHLATGQIGRPGTGPFSITGQPNAMGGREVGGLANQLTAHVDFGDPSRAALIERFWQAEKMATKPGLMAVDLFEAVHNGRIKALWIMGTNPAVSLPSSMRVKEALAKCPFVVVSDCIAKTDTSQFADVLLPAAGWGEKDGTVTNSERRISRQRAIQPLSEEARPDWWIIQKVAQKLGFSRAFNFANPSEVFKEYATLTRLVAKDLDLGELVAVDYQNLEPYQWHAKRPFADGRYFTASGKAKLLPIVPRLPAAEPACGQIRLNTGRYRDHWHTLTRTGLSPTLSRHRTEPLLDLNPANAQGLVDGDLIQLARGDAKVTLRLRLSDEVTPGSAFAPMHWNGVFAARASINVVTPPAVDPISGQPEFKASPITIASAELPWRAFVVSRGVLDHDGFDYWTRRRLDCGYLIELAHNCDATSLLTERLRFGHEPGWLLFEDKECGSLRAMRLIDGVLDTAICIGELPPRDWLVGLLGQPIGIEQRPHLLAGTDPGPGRGPIVCSCFAVHQNEILEFAASGALSVTAVGAAGKAGTNCGSCRPEIQALLTSLSVRERAAA